MTAHLGTVRPGSTIYIPFATYDSNDPSASVTLTGLAVTDVEIYKAGSVTQRSSDTGVTLLDTDGIDFDGVTGIHGFSIDLSSNADAGFFSAGSRYFVVVASVTVDAATINFIAATFDIGYPDAVINTTIASLSSQTSFTLTAGPAEDDALNGCVVCIHDVASAVQLGYAVIADYTGSTKTVTLTAGVTFTAAATDNISIFPPANDRWLGGTLQTGRDIGTSVLLSSGTGTGQVSLSSGTVTTGAISAGAITAAAIATDAIDDDAIATGAIASTAFAAGAITASAIAADAIGAAELAADAVTEIANAVWDMDATGHQTTGTFGQAIGDPVADTNTIFGAVVTGATGATIAADIITIDDFLDTEVAAIKTKTDQLTFTTANQVDAQALSVANAAITAASIATDAIDADALAADAVTEIWAKAMSDLSAVPGATASALSALNWLFELARNKITQTATTGTIFKDDASTSLATTTVSDDATTFTRGEWA